MNSDNDSLQIKVVQNEEERLKAFIVRSIVYIHEQNCPYDEEFDLNDFSATQILGQINGEPVLTARIRYFGSFAKLERLAIRPQYRGIGYGHLLLKFMLDFCREKGFHNFYLHAQERLQAFYEGYGFKRTGDPFAFSDHGYIEMCASLDLAAPGALFGQNPMIMNRPEGAWGLAGPIEASLARPQLGLAVS
jgi:predicted GNAT family N-acyltransferase